MAAARSPLRAVFRRWFTSASPNPGIRSRPFVPLVTSGRGFTAGPPSSAEDVVSKQDDGDLRSRIFRLRLPKRNAAEALDRWVEEGRKVTAPELRHITRELRRAQRYKHALEILSWVEINCHFRLSAHDHAIRLESIINVNGIAEAEAYLEKIEDSKSMKVACLPLLHAYMKCKDIRKAEILMSRLENFGLLVNPQPFNEMMKLYMSTGQYEKISYVIQQMKKGGIPCNILSYNLHMNACGEMSSIHAVEKVFKEMLNDKNIEVGWSTYATLANMYTKFGFHDKAFTCLGAAEKTLSLRNRLGYFFLITLYANLHDRAGVLRLWECSKRVPGKVTSANYMCIILCLVKVDDVEQAEKIFKLWESNCRKYDIRVPNVLLGAYVRKGWMDRAELLHSHTLEKGGTPNYKTWEILMEGWVKTKQMHKAVEAMKKGFSLLKDCHWRPSSLITLAIAQYFEEMKDVEAANKYVKVLRRLNVMNLSLYKYFIRTHIHAHQPARIAIKMMREDNIDLDDEVQNLIQCASSLPGISLSH